MLLALTLVNGKNPSVMCVAGGLAGQRFEFNDEPVVVGRHQDCAIRVDLDTDKMVSSRHAQFEHRRGYLFVRDLGSTNGTYVNGSRVQGEAEVTHGDRVELGIDGVAFIASVPIDPLNPTIAQAPGVPDLSHIAADGEHTGRTGFYMAMMEDAVQKSSSPLKKVITGLIVVLVLGGTWAGLYIWEQRQETAELQEQAKASKEHQDYTLEALKKADAAQVIAQEYGQALFMLIAQESESKLTGFCTAFALDKTGVLVTNAHCVNTIKTYRKAGITSYARMNGNPDLTYKVESWKSHPGYNNTPFSPDVAVLKLALIGAVLPQTVSLASQKSAEGLVTGDKIYTMGFPGKVMNEKRPAADLRAAIISRLTTYDNAPGDAGNTYVVWHTALTSRGTSGSPIFNANGKVVAINNGGLSAREVLVRDAKTGELKKELSYDATGLNFGIRVDTVRKLINN